MLTVQPKFTQYTQLHKNNTSFKGVEDCEIPNDAYYKSQSDYYENQIKEFDSLIEDEHTPNSFKKVLKGFKVVSEGLLEGCAVAWGASKGAKVIKSSTMKGINSNFAKKSVEILKPIAEGFKTTGSKFAKTFGEKVAKLKTSKFATKLSTLVEKMENNKVGKYVVKSFKAIGKALKWCATKVGKFASGIKNKVKSMNGSQVYDKAANVTSKTLGAGAGVAGAYNAAIRPDKNNGITYNQQTSLGNNAIEDIDYSEVEDMEARIEAGE